MVHKAAVCDNTAVILLLKSNELPLLDLLGTCFENQGYKYNLISLADIYSIFILLLFLDVQKALNSKIT